MDTSTLLGIVGIVATVIVGAWGIYITLDRKYPGIVTFIKEDNIALFDSIVRNFTELSVLYDGIPVSESLVLLKGYLLNTGSRDITENMVVEQLTLNLPDEFKWLTGKVVSASHNVQASVKIEDETKLIFDLGLFRKDEYIKFEAVAEVSSEELSTENTPSKLLEDSMEFSHRIADTRSVEFKDFPSWSISPKLRRRRKTLLIFGVAYFLFPLLFFVSLIWTGRGVQGELLFVLNLDSNRTLEIKAWPQSSGNLRLVSKDGLLGSTYFPSYSEEVTVDEFFQEMSWKPLVKRDNLAFLIFPLMLLMMGLGVIVIVGQISDWRRARNLAQKLPINTS